MCALEHLAALLGQLGLATVAGDLSEEDGAPGSAGALALAGLFALALLEDLLDGRRLGELLGMNGLGDLAPQLQRLVLELLRVWRKLLGRDGEGSDIDNRRLGLDGVCVLVC